MEFKSSLKKYRVDNKLTQDDLGKKLGLSGKVISKWESGYSMPDIDNIKKLCEIFDCEYADLIGPEKKNKKKKDNTLEDKTESEEKEKKNDKSLDLGKMDSKILKGISGVLYFFAKFAKIALYILVSFIVFFMIIIPSVISRINIENNTISYTTISGNIISLTSEDMSIKGNYILKYKDDVVEEKINFDILSRISNIFSETPKSRIIVNIEICLALVLISTAVSIVMFYNLELFLNNIHDNNTPFTQESIHCLGMITALMVAIYSCNIIISLLMDEFFTVETFRGIDIINLFEILFMFIMIYVFKYGYNLQGTTNGKIYADNYNDILK